VSATEIVNELPNLSAAELHSVGQRLLELARNDDVLSSTPTASDGAPLIPEWTKKREAIDAGDVWVVNFGDGSKGRPALLLTGAPADDVLDVVTTLLHTTALRGNRWELPIPKPFLEPGAFHLQQIQTVSTAKLERRLGTLTPDELEQVFDMLAWRMHL
jgi:mRNA-degrading endonuclease toxin of MazEF toxin-antitoxin module